MIFPDFSLTFPVCSKFPDFSLTGKCLPIFPGFPVRVGTLTICKQLFFTEIVTTVVSTSCEFQSSILVIKYISYHLGFEAKAVHSCVLCLASKYYLSLQYVFV